MERAPPQGARRHAARWSEVGGLRYGKGRKRGKKTKHGVKLNQHELSARKKINYLAWRQDLRLHSVSSLGPCQANKKVQLKFVLLRNSDQVFVSQAFNADIVDADQLLTWLQPSQTVGTDAWRTWSSATI